MRISTNTLFTQGQARISELQSGLVKTQQQLSTGRQILTPADDPIGAALVLNLQQGQAINQQFASNRLNAGNALQQQEGVLSSLDTLVQDLKTLLVSAGNGTLDDTQRGFIAVELDSKFDQMLALANSRDGMGNYQFSGYQVGVMPYARTAAGASFQGDAGVRMLQVDASRTLAVSCSGQQLFEHIDAASGDNIFATLRDLSDALKTPTTTPAAQAALSAQMQTTGSNLTTLLDRVLAARATIGAQQKEIDALDSAGSARDLDYAAAQSALQDVDYTKGISAFTQQQTTLDAAMKSYKAVTNLSLFALI